MTEKNLKNARRGANKRIHGKYFRTTKFNRLLAGIIAKKIKFYFQFIKFTNVNELRKKPKALI